MANAATRVFATAELLEMIQLEMDSIDIIASRRTSRVFDVSIYKSNMIQRRLMLKQDDSSDRNADDFDPDVNELIFNYNDIMCSYKILAFNMYHRDDDRRISMLPNIDLTLDLAFKEVTVCIHWQADLSGEYGSLRDVYLTSQACDIKVEVRNSSFNKALWRKATIDMKNARLGAVLDVAEQLSVLAERTDQLRHQRRLLSIRVDSDPTEDEECCICGTHNSDDKRCTIHWDCERYFVGMEDVLWEFRPEVDDRDIWLE